MKAELTKAKQGVADAKNEVKTRTADHAGAKKAIAKIELRAKKLILK